MEPVIGSKIKDKHSDAWLTGLAGHLIPGERVTMLVKTNLMRPTCDAVAITTARVAAFWGSEVAKTGPRREVRADSIRGAVVRKKMGSPTLYVTNADGDELSFGPIPAADIDVALAAVQTLASSGMPPELAEAADAAARAARQQDEVKQHDARSWQAVEVIGQQPSEKAWKVLADHSNPGETPWFAIGAGIQGVFAAFEDRCMIVKTGAMTSLMTGSFGGGRVTTFHYGEITGIEYNSGIMTGVLEVLTPSYQGSANKDFWRGSTKSRNSDSNDPWTLSNCLPMAKPIYQQALPRLNAMRAKIAESKRPTVVVNAATQSSGGGLAEELTKLAALRDQGVLEESEFLAAKTAALARHSRQ